MLKALGAMSTEMRLASLGGLATVLFLSVAILQPGFLEPDPDWDVSDGCLGGLEHADVGISEHYHPNLKITKDGQNVQIPPNTGIDQVGCRDGMRWIHVHDASETAFTRLHIETPSKMNVPLGAFFEVWSRENGPSLTGDREFDINRNGISDWEEFNITMSVNGGNNTDFESYIMEDLDDIELNFTSKS